MSDMIVSPEEIMSMKACQQKSENCYKFNIAPIMEEIKEIKTKLDDAIILLAKYGERIKPLERIVYGMVGMILTSVVLSLLYLVIKK